MIVFFFFKQKTAYEMRISDWSSDVCSSDLMSSEVRKVESYLEANRAKFQIKQIYSWYSEQGWASTQVTLFDDPDQIDGAALRPAREEIGRASCRERVCQYV